MRARVLAQLDRPQSSPGLSRLLRLRDGGRCAILRRTLARVGDQCAQAGPHYPYFAMRRWSHIWPCAARSFLAASNH